VYKSSSQQAWVPRSKRIPHTSARLLLTMVDGAAKYMADAKSYDQFTYEARNSSYARGAAEHVASAIYGFLEEMYHASTDGH
jgi:hypothetical protein